jgi:predicted MPP superfamily phosphohydrolase
MQMSMRMTVSSSLLLAAIAFAGCGGEKAHDTFRAVFITDTHIIGPQYVCCQENSDADNSSIMKTVDRLNAVRDTINALKPAPAMVFITGDIVHAAHVSKDPQYYRDNVNAYSIARDIFKTFNMPVYMTMGNHDYSVDCNDVAGSYDRQFSEDRFKEFLGAPPYQSVDYHGWKFVLINSQRGATFDVTSPNCQTEYASLGDEQMAWAVAQLGEKKPTIVMSHMMRILYDYYENGPYKSLPDLLNASPNVKGFFAGHSHRWVDMTGFNNDVFHWTMGGTRYDPNNFWLVEFDGTAGTFQVLDQDKAIPSNSCAKPYDYSGKTPVPAVGVADTGDCVSSFDTK